RTLREPYGAPFFVPRRRRSEARGCGGLPMQSHARTSRACGRVDRVGLRAPRGEARAQDAGRARRANLRGDGLDEGGEVKVTLIANTELVSSVVSPYAIEEWMDLDFESMDAEDLIEFAGRSCFQSFNKPNPATRANKDYIANIIAQGHHSVLEHASATFYIEGVSRALTHELIRHRHLSFSELSQRFVNVED